MRPTPGDASDTALGRLFRFYMQCLDEEDRQSLTLRLSGFHRSFISPWDNGVPEPLLNVSAVECAVMPRLKSDITFLHKGQLGVGDRIDLFYGYPTFIDFEDFITPIFFIPVELTDDASGVRLLVPDPTALQLNHHLFRKARFSVEELQEIKEQLEGPFGSFGARLREAFDLLGVREIFDSSRPLEPLPRPGLQHEQWISRGILFRNERSVFTANLRRELEALARYERLQRDVPETALGALLEGKDGTAARGGGQTVCQIVPLNDFQRRAAESAMHERLTVITGPPGTGKSQVVVDLLASCARDQIPALFASKNNKAVDVVSEQLQRLLGDDDWSLRLGSRDYVDKTRESLHVRLASEAPLRQTTDSRSARDATMMIQRLERRRQLAVDTMDHLSESVSERRRLEHLVPPSWRGAPRPADLEAVRATHARAYYDALALSGKERLSLWLWISRLLAPRQQRHKLVDRTHAIVNVLGEKFTKKLDDSSSINDVVATLSQIKIYLNWLAVGDREQELRAQVEALEPIGPLEKELSRARESLCEISRQELALSWTRRVRSQSSRLNASAVRYFASNDALRSGQARGGRFLDDLDDTIKNLKVVSDVLPVWIVTSLSARRGVPLAPAIFDLVIIDEASQCDIASAIPLLFRAKRAVIIGDPKHLRHISTLDLEAELRIRDDLGTRDYWNDGWTHTNHSLYELAELVADRQCAQPYVLSEHYRSDASIIGFSNRAFYGGQLVVRTKPEKLARTGFEPGVFWHNHQGVVPPGTRSASNPSEADAVIDLIRSWVPRTLGVVTPFRRQMEVLESAVLRSNIPHDVAARIRVGTAHRFQGDECDIMVFSPVIAKGLPQRLSRWVARTDQLLNVSITRARAALHVVGDLAAAQDAGGVLAEFAAHVSDRQPDAQQMETSEERVVGEMLETVGLYYRPQVRMGRYRLDFEVISPFGTRWALEIDGLQHWEEDGMDRDEARDTYLRNAGYRVARISNRDVRDEPVRVRTFLERLY
jgi:very-short-patch-repair endonuclease